jgi:hypothetical protein
MESRKSVMGRPNLSVKGMIAKWIAYLDYSFVNEFQRNSHHSFASNVPWCVLDFRRNGGGMLQFHLRREGSCRNDVS